MSLTGDMYSMHSVYDEVEGRADGMMAYQACHLCHNGNKKCERPVSGGQCKRCANTYVTRVWTSEEHPPSFLDYSRSTPKVLREQYTEVTYSELTDHVWAQLHELPSIVLSLFESPTAYRTMTISFANPCRTETRENYNIHFLGPFRHDNPNLVQQFDQMVERDWSAPRVDISNDLHGLVARACLAGGYLYLFFAIDKIKDGSQDSLDPRALTLALGHFILMRISSLISDAMSFAYIRPISRNARLSLTALHVMMNRIKLFTSRQAYLRPLYDDVKLSTLLRDRIHAIEGELRELFRDDCGLIKDWGAPLNSPRKEFKNTSQSIDPLILTVAVTTWDDVPGHGMYPLALNTPSESGLSPIPIGLIPEIELPTQQFAGLEDSSSSRIEGSPVFDQPSRFSQFQGNASSKDHNDLGMDGLITYDEIYTCSPITSDTNHQDKPMADSVEKTSYRQAITLDSVPTEWEAFFNADEMSNIDYQEQVLGSPFSWDRDPGASDVALD